MKKLISVFILLIVVITMIFQSGIYRTLLGTKTAYAVGDLTVSWGVPSGNPIFTISNLAPGQTQTHSVTVTNGSTLTRTVGVSGEKTSESGGLADALTITISHNGTDIYGGTMGEKTVSQFFTESALPNFVTLSSLNAGQTTNYVFIVKFKNNAGNEFQNKTLTMDLIIGLAVTVPSSCQGIQFTGKVITGTSGNDTLSGTSGNDLIMSLEGNDRILGGGGDDCIVGGDGNDVITGDNGNDVIDGGIGIDQITGGNGNDTVLAGDGNDTIDLGNGDDNTSGGSGNDQLLGGNGNDILIGEQGTDTAIGGSGQDTCSAEQKISCEL